ncbi:glutamate synthase large subunit, partial [Nannochloropsis oceanica]
MLRLLSSGRVGFLASSVNGGTSVSTPAAALARRRLQQGASAGVGQARLITRFPDKQGLYDPASERDSCGVGLVAQLKKQASRQIVVDANEMLVRMSHRGGCGCEPNTGDGAGMLVGLPDLFLRKVAKAELGKTLPALGKYAVGNVFVGKNDVALQEAKDVIARIVKQRGFKLLGIRLLPTDNTALGASALATEPHVLQMFVENTKNFNDRDFDREMFRVRKLIEAEAELSPHLKDLYICSLSNQTLTYKGQLTPEQLYDYYGDLHDKDFTSHMALVHSRFSTNTFPSWDRAQPLRMMCHNGEINTLRGNKNMASARGGLMESPYFKDDTAQLLPIASDKKSDSGNFDSCLETLAKASNRTLPETIMMMVPEAWQDNQYIGATLDRNGLRPSRYYVTHDDRVLLSSEVGVLSELPDSIVRTKARLEPGKMFLVDFDKGEIVPDGVIKEEVSAHFPYGEWLNKNLFSLDDWTAHSKATGIIPPPYNLAESNRHFNMFGYTTETLDLLLYPMAVGGKEALGSMGNDAPLAVLSQQPRNMSDYFKQLFAQVTNPPIDPIREEMVMSLVCPVGPEANLLEVGPEHCHRLMVNHPVLTLEQLEAIKDTEFRGWRARTIDMTFPVGTGPQGLQVGREERREGRKEGGRGEWQEEKEKCWVFREREKHVA